MALDDINTFLSALYGRPTPQQDDTANIMSFLLKGADEKRQQDQMITSANQAQQQEALKASLTNSAIDQAAAENKVKNTRSNLDLIGDYPFLARSVMPNIFNKQSISIQQTPDGNVTANSSPQSNDSVQSLLDSIVKTRQQSRPMSARELLGGGGSTPPSEGISATSSPGGAAGLIPKFKINDQGQLELSGIESPAARDPKPLTDEDYVNNRFPGYQVTNPKAAGSITVREEPTVRKDLVDHKDAINAIEDLNNYLGQKGTSLNANYGDGPELNQKYETALQQYAQAMGITPQAASKIIPAPFGAISSTRGAGYYQNLNTHAQATLQNNIDRKMATAGYAPTPKKVPIYFSDGSIAGYSNPEHAKSDQATISSAEKQQQQQKKANK